MRSKEGQKKHDGSVGNVAQEFLNKGFTVYADLPGYTKPPTLKGYVPDIYAVKTGYFRGFLPIIETKVVEIETEDSKDTYETKLQLSNIKVWCDANNASVQVVIAN